MAAATTTATPTVTDNSATTFDLSDHLPLQLIKSDIIPPAPNRSESAIDWLPDFEGYSWIAYGASSLLVISHLPSPLSQCENLISPVFRQVLELSSDGSGSVSAVSWSSASPSVGELAASLDNCIGLFTYNSEGSFCWSQTAILAQSTRVEAVKWTGSGDGIVSGGIEVVLWRRKGYSWEIAWKFRPELSQVLISATWSIGGAFATAPLSKAYHESSSSAIIDASRCVLVCRGEGISKHVVAELRHPMPVSMIQWRPSASAKSDEISRNSLRRLLLTCCADGTVRLWGEMDDGRVRKTGKDINDQKSMGLSFRVTAVIEMNQAVNGILGKDVFVQWATELDHFVSIQKEARLYFSSKECLHDSTGSCEWLVAVGPQRLVTLWAIHCLDDVSPPRFPRVTLWKRLDVTGPQMAIEGVVLHKAIISRNQGSGPPVSCSVVRLLTCNSLEFLHLNSQKSLVTEDGSLSSESDNLMSFRANKSLNVDSHTGKMLQLAVHSYGHKFHLSVSLDTKGLLLFWSFSNGIIGLSTLYSACQFSGKLVVQDSRPKYTSLSWAPTTIGECKVLVLGHVGGIDCFIVKICETEVDKVLCHKLCTIPFPIFHEEGPTCVRSVPLTLSSNGTIVSYNFLLIAIYKNDFEALSWKVTIHPCDLPGSFSNDSYDIKHTHSAENTMFKFESDFSGKRYSVSVDPCSSVLPDPQKLDKVMSYAVVEPSDFVPPEEQKRIIVDGVHDKYSLYHMVTGSFDGILKLWRSVAARPLNSNLEWELVGVLDAHEGPITRVSPSDNGRRIATISPSRQSNSSSILRIWECVHLTDVGSFLHEDTLFLDGEVVALKWLTLGNGQLLLGICLQNKLQIYATNRCGVNSLVESKETTDKKIWFCAAVSYTYPAIRDFFWGPNSSAIVVHDDYFCLYSQWVLPVDMKLQVKCHLEKCKENYVDCNVGSSEHTTILTDSNICDFVRLTINDNNKECCSTGPMKMNVKSYFPSSMFEMLNQKHYTGTDFGLWSLLEVAEKFGGSIPVYHPEALMINIYSGNWKRALVALRHLIKFLTSNKDALRSSSLAKSSHVIPPVDLSNYLEGVSAPSSSDKAFKLSGDPTSNSSSSLFTKDLFSFSSSWDSDGSSNLFSSSSKRSELIGLGESIEKLYDLAAITNFEKLQILAIIDLLDEVSNPQSASAYGSLDEPGQRFWLAVRFQQLCFARRCGRLPSMEELVVNSRMTAWGFYSDCQENLFNSLLTNEASWQEMRNLGVGFWYTNAAQLRLKMEKLARQQYLKSKDPKSCTLLYIALNRLQVLAGLFKISKDEKDKPLVGFLSRNFQEEKNKAAALKNAYVLMGRHQLDLAVAFFLLGGDATSAINVCAKNLKDEQLAIVICRLVEGSGGPLEHHLVSKFLLPSAIEKGDYWFASFLQWMLGNYSQAFFCMLGNQMDSLTHGAALLSNHTSFRDPSIGHYCLMLATKNSMKNSVGELNAAILSRWAVLMSSTALSRCGLPLEALECLSSSQNMFGGLNQGSVSSITNPEILNERLKPSRENSSSNWILSDVVFYMDLRAKSDFAMKYVINLLREHPSWQEINMASPGACAYSSSEIQEQKMLLSSFEHKLTTVLAFFEQKFSLIPQHLIRMILMSLCNNGLGFIGYYIYEWYISKDLSLKKGNTFDGSHSFSILPILLRKATEEMSYLCLRYVVGCSMKCSNMISCSSENSVASESRYDRLASCRFYMQDLQRSLWHVRAALKLFSDFDAEFITKALIVLDLYEYYVFFASAWLQRNPEGIVLAVKPHFITSTNVPAPSEANEHNLSKLVRQIAEALAHNRSMEYLDAIQTNGLPHHDQAADIKHLIPVDEKWQIIHASLWRFMSGFLKHQIDSLLEKLEDDYSFHSPHKLLSFTCNASRSDSDANNLKKQIELIFVLLAKLINITSENISSCSATRFVSFLLQKIGDRTSPTTLQWFEELSKSQPSARNKNLAEDIAHLSMANNEHELSDFETLWYLVTDTEILAGGLALEYSEWLQYIKQKYSIRWTDVCTHSQEEVEAEENCDQGARLAKSSSSNAVASPRSPDSPSVISSGTKDSTAKAKSVPYQNPKELYKRNGELLEALCINSTDQKQAAVASNKKGIIFFNWEDGSPSIKKSDYIWTDVDWPHDGWAGCESIPVPTCVSPGVGLGRKKGTHLGLGGATIGVDSLARPGRDFTGGEAFGIPGYAGVGASGLGWETQEDFEDLVDPPATVENVRTRAFSSHPSRPFFLVGSSNTHIYLWEFGKERAIATYGVLPAANVPPPYALASINAVEFDQCGQRFATAASDGTVCTWQLEVGGRSNIHPTESSSCFNNYTSDVRYVTASGSIVAATGYSSNNLNVVIWDTFAPPTKSRASIMCHEGGARSLSVFANDVGSGSISPLIVTGGKGGDVGIHDFRYIATGRPKRHRNSDSIEQKINASSTAGMQSKHGDQNRNGMLWYIPKAHSGSVTRISAIPNTNLFLTGSKDGDVKLWDAKRAKLVFHWPKLHDRHTFLQPNSRGFGGVVRAAVTDIQVVDHGFLSCGGDGSVKLVQLKDFRH